MTEKELKGYGTLMKELGDLEKRIERERKKPVDIVSGKVKASMTEFPYTEIHVGVQMEDPVQADTTLKIIRLYESKKEDLIKKKLEIEQFICGIEDPMLEMIFRYTYIDGLKQKEVAKRVNIERSYVSKKIRAYLQLSHNSQKSVI